MKKFIYNHIRFFKALHETLQRFETLGEFNIIKESCPC